jgi:hypothetical protein
LLVSGCGGSQIEPAGSVATKESAPATTSARQPAPATRTAADARGDTASGDLDIVQVRVTRDDLIRVELTLAEPPGADVIYSASLSCGDQLWQLGYKIAAGTVDVFAFDFVAGQQYEADGVAEGTTVSISYPAAEMGCTGTLDVQFVAEGTRDRPPDSDYVPEPGPDPLSPKRLRVA